MREDMNKLLCLRRRIKTHHGKKDKGRKKNENRELNKHPEDVNLPRKESMRAAHPDRKLLNEYLQPLIRYLRSSVGRPWDDIYSEIKKTCPNDSAVNAHIYEHLWDFVELHAWKGADGKVYHIPEFSHKRMQPSRLLDGGQNQTFCVDENKILQKAPYENLRPQKGKKENKNLKRIDGRTFVLKNNIWHEAILKPLPKYRLYSVNHEIGDRVIKITNKRYGHFYDKILNVGYHTEGYDGAAGARQCKYFYGENVYCEELKQLNSKQIKKFGLRK